MSSVDTRRPPNNDDDFPQVPDSMTAVEGERDGTVRVYDESADEPKEAWIEGTTIKAEDLP